MKVSGDWTKDLYDNLKSGMEAHVEASFGMFNYKRGGPKQIWIAGGIGVLPFLSWVRDFGGEPQADIEFYYTMRAEAEALFWASSRRPTSDTSAFGQRSTCRRATAV